MQTPGSHIAVVGIETTHGTWPDSFTTFSSTARDISAVPAPLQKEVAPEQWRSQEPLVFVNIKALTNE